MLSFLGLSVLSLFAGFLSSYMGIGGGIVIVSLLPVFTDFSPGETIQISLCLVFCLTLSNSLIFLRKNLVAWDWTIYLIAIGGGVAFFAGSLVPELSNFFLRFLLWCFLFLVVFFPFIAKKLSYKMTAKNKLSSLIPIWFKIFGGALMGLCSGLTGVGGGIILSPLLHESSVLSLKKISPSLSFATLFMSVFALLGQLSKGISLNVSMKSVFPNLLLFAVLGLALGHFFHGRDKRRKRIFIVRTVTVILFLKVSMELPFLYYAV